MTSGVMPISPPRALGPEMSRESVFKLDISFQPVCIINVHSCHNRSSQSLRLNPGVASPSRDVLLFRPNSLPFPFGKGAQSFGQGSRIVLPRSIYLYSTILPSRMTLDLPSLSIPVCNLDVITLAHEIKLVANRPERDPPWPVSIAFPEPHIKPPSGG